MQEDAQEDAASPAAGSSRRRKNDAVEAGSLAGRQEGFSVPGAAALFETRISVQSALTTARWVGEGRRFPPSWRAARKAVGEAISRAVSTKIV